MKRGAIGEGARRGRPRRLWMLMFGAFLAGLLVVGVAFLLPQRQPKAPSPLAPAPPAEPPQEKAPPPSGSPVPPRLSIVVDGLGYEPSRDAEWLEFPVRITVAVIPFGPSSRKVAESARARGWGVILNVPMEPETPSSDRTERFRIRRGMTADEMESLLARMIENLPQASGVCNHMGSAFTADPEAMAAYASILGKRGLFLLDSVTTPKSVALEAAKRAGVPAARRDAFLDAGMSAGEMRRQWEQALAIAREKGAAVLLCRGRGDTLRTLLPLVRMIKEEKIQAVNLEELLRDGGR